jgi:hypothetical protein
MVKSLSKQLQSDSGVIQSGLGKLISPKMIHGGMICLMTC